jgi:4-amino-4-deoxy-L-arabinose transferase-like glycosyltransferase
LTRLSWLWILALLIKIIVAGYLPLSPDEAYYWVWSKYPQMSYFDHPPFVAWLFQFGRIFENYHSFVRIPSVIFLHFSFWIWIPILKRFLGDDEVWKWAILWLLNPLTGPGSIVVTPDLPLMFFLPLATLALLRTIETKSLKWAASFGVCLGLGFCSKYHMGLFGLIALIWALWERKLTRGHLLCLLMATFSFSLTSLPVWLWNLNNEFASFRFQIHHGLGHSKWNPFWTWSYFIGQVGLLFPFVVWAFLLNFRSKRLPKWVNFFALGPLIFFLASSFRGKVEANWPIVAYPFFLAVAGLYFPSRLFKITLVTWVALTSFFIVDLGFGIIPEKWTPSKLKEIKRIESAFGETREYRPLFVHSYQIAAKMSFLNREAIYKLRGSGRFDFFDGLEGSMPPKVPFYFLTLRGESLPVEYVKDFMISDRTEIGDDFDLLKVIPQ